MQKLMIFITAFILGVASTIFLAGNKAQAIPGFYMTYVSGHKCITNGKSAITCDFSKN